MVTGLDFNPKSGGLNNRINMKLIFAAVVLCNLASCGTIDGIGRDISGGANTVGGWFR